MKRQITFLLAAGIVLTTSSATDAQVRGSKNARPVAARSAAPAPAPEPVDVRTVFNVATTSESWSIDDALPRASVPFSGRQVSLEERQVNASKGLAGDEQLLFPISWHPAYAEADPHLKYVVVRYHDGRAHYIIAEYMPEKFSLPRDQFQLHPDGKTYYADLAFARQDGKLYSKQAISQGKGDGRGGLFVDTIILSCTEDTKAISQKSATKP